MHKLFKNSNFSFYISFCWVETYITYIGTFSFLAYPLLSLETPACGATLGWGGILEEPILKFDNE